jgi:hypothetical protein
LSLNRSEPAKKSGPNIPKNRCRTTIAERRLAFGVVETRAELPFIGDRSVCLSHDQAARSLPMPKSGWMRDHEYKRHGTLTLMAGIDLLTGHVHALVKGY